MLVHLKHSDVLNVKEVLISDSQSQTSVFIDVEVFVTSVKVLLTVRDKTNNRIASQQKLA